MEWRLNKEQIAEVVAMFTELCEKITDEEVSLNLNIRKNNAEEGKTLYTYDVHAIYKGKLIYIKMGSYRSLMDSDVTSVDVEGIIKLLKGDK
jgi:hypothetical protein